MIAVEPNIKKLSREEKFCLVNQDNARLKADIKVLLVDHKEFKKNKEIGSYIIDTKGCW